MAYGGKPLIAQADGVAPAPFLPVSRNDALRYVCPDPDDRAAGRSFLPLLPSAEKPLPFLWVRKAADGGFEPI